MYLGFDIGGSSVKVVAVKNKKIIFSKIFADSPRSLSAFLKIIREARKKFEKRAGNKKIKGVGFSIANPLDKKREKIVSEHKFVFLHNLSLKKILEKEMKPYPVMIEHDSHCFLIAEKKVGIAKNFNEIYYLALGSSVGDALMINGEIVRGNHGSAGQIVDTVLEISKKTKLRKLFGSRYVKKYLNISFSTAAERANKGNKTAIKMFDKMGYNLGAAVANVMNVIDPAVIIIGGGQLPSRRFFLPGIKRAINEFVISAEAKKTTILFSKLGRFGGALGATLLFEKNKK
jgi:predicted NBD/HSP70 family sugar kinase